MTLRTVDSFDYVGACRYTGYEHKSILLKLECGHELQRKASEGVPRRAHCRECKCVPVWRSRGSRPASAIEVGDAVRFGGCVGYVERVIRESKGTYLIHMKPHDENKCRVWRKRGKTRVHVFVGGL
jgi:hypothetical protein